MQSYFRSMMMEKLYIKILLVGTRLLMLFIWNLLLEWDIHMMIMVMFKLMMIRCIALPVKFVLNIILSIICFLTFEKKYFFYTAIVVVKQFRNIFQYWLFLYFVKHILFSYNKDYCISIN